MDAKLPGGAGDSLHALIADWSTSTAQTNDFAPVNLGQLKKVAAPFYDRLIAAGLANQYPWANAPNQPDDFAVANIGQVKNLFAFELPTVDPLFDGDHNGLPDAWERQYFGAVGVDPNGDFDGDGISNLQEYMGGTDPTDFFNGALVRLSVTGGGDQRGNPGAALPVPILIKVNDYGVLNAPVTFNVAQGGALLMPDNGGTGTSAGELTVRANAYDTEGRAVARVYVLLPSTPGDVSVIRASARGALGRSVSVTTTAAAIDASLVAPTNLIVAASSSSSARLSWTPGDDSKATTVQVSIDGGRTWITLGVVKAGITHATVTGLTVGHVAKFRVFSGGTPSVSDTASFALPDASNGSPPPPPGPGGSATESVDVKPLGAPVLEIETASVSRGKFGFPGLLNQGGPYRDETVVITSNYTRNDGDGTPDPSSGTTTIKHHWQRSDDGGHIYTIDTTEVTGGGGYLNSPWTTVINTDTVFRQEGAPFPGSSGGSSRTITLSDLYTDEQVYAEGDALVPPFYNEFWTARNDAYAYFRKKNGGYEVTFLQYRFQVNADPNLVVLWDVQFTPDGGGPLEHNIQSWTSDGSTQTPTYLLDPRTYNGGRNGTYNVVPISAELMVDGNRDGEMSFDDPVTHANDQTTQDRPYRFWVNDDDDGASGDPGDHVPVQTPDYADGVIRSSRDLEDFARLHVNLSGLGDQMESGSITAAFEWRQTSGTPKIKLYRAATEDGDYITNAAVATSTTLSPFRETLGEVIPGVPLMIPQTFWVSASPYANIPNTLPVAPLLFEGSGEGKGKLVLTLWKTGVKIGETSGVWLDLQNVKKMYQHQTLGGPNAWDDAPYEPPPDEQKQVIVFVHGWRLSPADTANFAETMFKRLWWRGFKGRFAAVRWDTYYNSTEHGWIPYAGQTIDAYLSKYNDSEHNAWMTGKALKDFVSDSLPSDYDKNIVAHSMGNVVTGSALEQGMLVDTYALLNAALPAACYDESSSLKQNATTTTAAGLTVHLWDQDTPDDDADQFTRALAYRSRLKNVSGTLVTFYLADDYATSFAWELNNALTKPPSAPLAGPFFYKRNFPSGHKLIKSFEDPSNDDAEIDHYITDRNEAEPYACRTWAKAVGAESRTNGPFARKIDLNSNNFSPGSVGGFSKEHSAEFDRDVQPLTPFFRELLRQLAIPQNE